MAGTRIHDRKLFLGGRRHHHGLFGLEMIVTGLLLCWHDRRDVRRWISDFRFARTPR